MAQTRSRGLATAAAAVAVLLISAACSGGGSSKSGSSSTPTTNAAGGAKKTITIGVITDASGAAASGNKTFPNGVKAGTFYADRNGYTIKYVVADTQTNPTAALSAAKQLVTQKHVSAVLVESALAFGAAPYLTAQKIPVIGVSQDGPEWITSKNMFALSGVLRQDKVATTAADFFKKMGATNIGTLGYSISPSSAEYAKGEAIAAQAVGLKSGYVNSKFPFGSTDVQPVALAMKQNGVDGMTAAVDPNTGFALVTALRNSGAAPKVSLLPTGYGGDLAQAGPGALQAAQGVYFFVGEEPVEMQTAATKQFVSDLKSAGVTTEPTYAEYNGYLSAGLLVRALKEAGGNTSPAALTTALTGIHNYDGLGLWGGRTSDPNDRENTIAGVGNCLWFVKLVGSNFQVVKGAAPICGTEVKGAKVSG
jgi:ABC-type branched-subunit amino acid transport system substrate-binding protein